MIQQVRSKLVPEQMRINMNTGSKPNFPDPVSNVILGSEKHKNCLRGIDVAESRRVGFLGQQVEAGKTTGLSSGLSSCGGTSLLVGLPPCPQKGCIYEFLSPKEAPRSLPILW
jgi:hypothetical protein